MMGMRKHDGSARQGSLPYISQTSRTTILEEGVGVVGVMHQAADDLRSSPWITGSSRVHSPPLSRDYRDVVTDVVDLSQVSGKGKKSKCPTAVQ